MSAFGPTHRLSTYDRNFDGAHAVLVARVYNEDRVWWCDPEAPLGSYQGVWVTKAELQKFVNAFSGSHVVQKVKVPAPAPVPSGDIMPALTAYLPGYTANIKPLSNIRALPASTATKLRVSGSVKEPVVLIGTVKGTVDPANGSDVWYVWWKNARYEYTAKDNILDVKAPAAAPTYPDLSKELADAQAQLAERSATVNEQSIIIAADKTIIADLRARLDRIVKRITDLTL
jgi:uncharacterized coiled-coil protein SlyX